MPPIITIAGLTKRYKDADADALTNVSLAIGQGQIMGILGPNGAGKTTLISILCGLLEPSSGSFTLDGLTYTGDASRIKNIIGVVPQDVALYPTLTAMENLRYFGSMYGLRGRSLTVTIRTSLERLGLLRFADKRIDTFSGGMKRRVNLLAGMLHGPKMLFLDEPTVGVDVQSKNAIIEYLKELNAAGTTIIYTSHHLTEAENFCTDIAILDHGIIHAEGSPRSLIATTPNAETLEDVFISFTGNDLRDDA